MHPIASNDIWERARAECLAGARALSVPLTAQQIDSLIEYLRILLRWNRTYNLTAIDDPLQAVDRLMLESLAIAPWLGPGPALDAGSGAGLPGLPLAIAEPARRWLLLDSNGKKVRFLRHVARALALGNVMPVHQRLERYLPEAVAQDWRPRQIISRALAPPQRLCRWAGRWLAAGCRLLIVAGAGYRNATSELAKDCRLVEAVELPPIAGRASYLLIIEQYNKGSRAG